MRERCQFHWALAQGFLQNNTLQKSAFFKKSIICGLCLRINVSSFINLGKLNLFPLKCQGKLSLEIFKGQHFLVIVILNIFQGKTLSTVESPYFLYVFALNWNLSAIFLIAFSASLIPGTSRFYIWMTRCPMISSFMSNLTITGYQSIIQFCFLPFPLSLKSNLAH